MQPNTPSRSPPNPRNTEDQVDDNASTDQTQDSLSSYQPNQQPQTAQQQAPENDSQQDTALETPAPTKKSKKQKEFNVEVVQTEQIQQPEKKRTLHAVFEEQDEEENNMVTIRVNKETTTHAETVQPISLKKKENFEILEATFEGLKQNITQLQKSRQGPSKRIEKRNCLKHAEDQIHFFCRQCSVPVCGQCLLVGEHVTNKVPHDYCTLEEKCKENKQQVAKKLKFLQQEKVVIELQQRRIKRKQQELKRRYEALEEKMKKFDDESLELQQSMTEPNDFNYYLSSSTLLTRNTIPVCKKRRTVL